MPWWDDAPRLARLMRAVALWEGRGVIRDGAHNVTEDARGRYQMRPGAHHDALGRPATAAERNRLFTDYEYAADMFIAYLRKWCPRGDESDENLARTWNGGPSGPWKRCTYGYWTGVKEYLNDMR